MFNCGSWLCMLLTLFVTVWFDRPDYPVFELLIESWHHYLPGYQRTNDWNRPTQSFRVDMNLAFRSPIYRIISVSHKDCWDHYLDGCRNVSISIWCQLADVNHSTRRTHTLQKLKNSQAQSCLVSETFYVPSVLHAQRGEIDIVQAISCCCLLVAWFPISCVFVSVRGDGPLAGWYTTRIDWDCVWGYICVCIFEY